MATKDHLDIAEISKRNVRDLRPDALFRTHVHVHKEAKEKPDSRKVVRAHKFVADEMLKRGFMHHQWDKLDAIYMSE